MNEGAGEHYADEISEEKAERLAEQVLKRIRKSVGPLPHDFCLLFKYSDAKDCSPSTVNFRYMIDDVDAAVASTQITSALISCLKSRSSVLCASRMRGPRTQAEPIPTPVSVPPWASARSRYLTIHAREVSCCPPASAHEGAEPSQPVRTSSVA